MSLAGVVVNAWAGGVSRASADANKIFAGPATGAADTPAFRALVTADIPTTDLITAQVDLTAAQIKAWNTTPISIIPAPGAGKGIRLISCILSYKYIAPIYTAPAGYLWLRTDIADANTTQWQFLYTNFLTTLERLDVVDGEYIKCAVSYCHWA